MNLPPLVEKFKFGFYSAEACAEFGDWSLYQTIEGGEVEVTAITDDIEGKGYKWPDKQFVGMVTNFIRKVKADEVDPQKLLLNPLMNKKEFESFADSLLQDINPPIIRLYDYQREFLSLMSRRMSTSLSMSRELML